MVVIDEDQQWLANCLTATLDSNQEVRSFAEASLHQASLRPGFGKALSMAAANRELSPGLRQLAAVLLKQFIKKHWKEGDESLEHPVVSSDEKEGIRESLLSSLEEPHRKIRTAISVAIASIALYDWPEDWPDLLPTLLKLINEQTNLNGVHGGLRCLAILCADMDDLMAPTLVPALFPCLHKIVSSQTYDNYLCTKALSIVYSCTSVIGAMRGIYKTEATQLMVPMLKPWMDLFSAILGKPVPADDPDDWSMRTEVLKCLNQIVQNFPSLADNEFIAVLGPLWQTFMTTLHVYLLSSVEGRQDSYDGRYDSDGADKSLDSFVVQLFEFLLTLVGSTRLVKVVWSNLKELVYYTIAYLQITEEQINTWSTDANQFVADEDEVTYSCRVSGALLLEEVVSSCGTEGIKVIIDAARERFKESQQEKAAGSAVWWRMREATLFALVSLSDQLLEAEVSEPTSIKLGNFVEQMISEDIGTGVHEYPYLCARIFVSVSKFSSVISHGILEQLLYAAIKVVAMNVLPPVKVGTCRALSQLLSIANKGTLQPQMASLFSSLVDLLHQASDETLHLVLETLQAAVKAGHEESVLIDSIVTPVVLNIWALHVSDPFVGIDAIEVLEAIKNTKDGLHPLVSRILSHIGPILSKPHQQPEGLIAGSLDLVTMLLKNASRDIVKAIYDVCFNSVAIIILQSDDHSEMQNATQCLAAFVSEGREDVLSWAPDSGFVMRSLLDIASRLLDPNMESSGSLFVGGFILQLLFHFPSQMVQHIRDLITALVRRMQSAQITALRSSLIVVFARMVHMSAPNVEQYIDMLISIPAEGYDNSLTYIISEWTKLQGEIQGAYQIKVTTTALALLLSTRHAELGKITVQGHFVESTGIKTRSKSKSAPDKWTMVPLPVKILSLLADALVEIHEQILDGDNEEDSDWEEAQEDDMEHDESLLYSAASATAKLSGGNSFDELVAVAKAYGETEDDDFDLLNDGDPLNEINLVTYLGDFFTKFSQGDIQLFNQLCQRLTPSQRDTIQMVLKRYVV